MHQPPTSAVIIKRTVKSDGSEVSLLSNIMLTQPSERWVNYSVHDPAEVLHEMSVKASVQYQEIYNKWFNLTLRFEAAVFTGHGLSI